MKLQSLTPKDIMSEIKGMDIKMVDLRFTDMPGTTQHFTIPIKFLDEDVFSEGLGFDGSSVRGFQEIQDSDMIMLPDASTAFIDPFYSEKTLVFHCNIKDPVSLEDYSGCPLPSLAYHSKFL